MGTLTVLLGGARSGKSTAALKLARSSGQPVTFVATSPRIEGDDDLAARIAAHESERPAEWSTIEAEIDLPEAIESAAPGTVVVDCLTVWLGNLLHHGLTEPDVESISSQALQAVFDHDGNTIVVTNEVGLGIIPADAGVRHYRDLLGRINQRWVAASDRSLFMVAGRALPLVEPEMT